MAAPMAGGPSTPELVSAVGSAGGLGFLAAGYRTADAVAANIAAVRAAGAAPFGVNVFVPPAGPEPSRGEVEAYRERLMGEYARYGVDAPNVVLKDDDAWDAKLDMLASDPVPVVSFTFGCPPRGVVERLHRAGSAVWVTVTSAEEAAAAAAVGADALCVQGPEAGGHRGTFDAAAPAASEPGLFTLLRQVRAAHEDVPLVAAGGIADGIGIAAALAAGAHAAQLGTAFLRTPEAGTKTAYRVCAGGPRVHEHRGHYRILGAPGARADQSFHG